MEWLSAALQVGKPGRADPKLEIPSGEAQANISGTAMKRDVFLANLDFCKGRASPKQYG